VTGRSIHFQGYVDCNDDDDLDDDDDDDDLDDDDDAHRLIGLG
jgi:hypothetical protein